MEALRTKHSEKEDNLTTICSKCQSFLEFSVDIYTKSLML